MNLKLRTLLLIAILLISGNACFAQTQTTAPHGKRAQALFPLRYKCLDLLELERIKVNPQTNDVSDDAQVAEDYIAVTGWFQGFFTAVNITAQPDGNVTKGTEPHQWITRTFSYCRAHPLDTLVDAALDLLKAFRRDTRR